MARKTHRVWLSWLVCAGALGVLRATGFAQPPATTWTTDVIVSAGMAGGDLDAAPVRVGPVEPIIPPDRAWHEEVRRGGFRAGPALRLTFVGVGVPPEGDTPSEIAFTPDGSKFVIAHRDSQNLIVFDAASRNVIQVIPVSGSPNSLAIAPDGVHVVTANLFEDTASIASLATGTELAVVPVGDQPGTVRITPDGTKAIVGNTMTSTLSVVDLASATELRQIAGAAFFQVTSWGSWAVTYRFTDYKITPDSATVVFPDYSNNRIQFFSIATGSAVSAACDAKPCMLDMSPDGTVAVFTHEYPLTEVTVVNVPGRSITKVIPTGGSATSVPSIAMNPSKTKAIVAVQNAVRVVNLSTNAVSADLSLGGVTGLLTTADGQYCIVGNYLGSLVSYSSESIVGNFLNSTMPDGMAVSPANARSATIHALRKEVTEVLNVNGAAGHLEGVVPTGPPPEGDKARNVAVSADGQTAVVINNHSQNATVIDVSTRTVKGIVATGERPGAVAINPAGTKAVVANLDSYFATIIDLTTLTPTNVSMGRRGSAVAISLDGQYAYIPVVADGDGVYRLNINTASIVGSKLATGDMGGIGYIFDLSSGATLSHDGATLVTCGSFTNNVSIINTATWTEVARVTVGTFPTRAAFSPDDSRIYVSNKNANTVSVVTNAGASSSVIATIPVGSQPFELTTNPAATKLYVANFGAKSVSVVDLPANTVSATIPIPPTNGGGEPVGLHVSTDGSTLYVAANGADFHMISTASNAIIGTINTGLAPADFQYHDLTNRAFMPSPLGADGLSIVSVVTLGDMNCDGVVNNQDIDHFVQALFYPAQYAADHDGDPYAPCEILCGDFTGDDVLNNQDIDGFVAALFS